MKKGFKVGFNGNIGITAGYKEIQIPMPMLSYRGKNYNILGSGAYRQNIGKSNSESYRTNIFPDTTFYYNQFNNSHSESDGGNFRLGFDLDISPKQSLRLSTNYNINKNNSITGNDFYYLRLKIKLLRVYEIKKTLAMVTATTSYLMQIIVYKLIYRRKINYGDYRKCQYLQRMRSYNRTYAFPANLSPSLQENSNEVGNQGLNFNLDYDKPVFKKRDQLEFGVAYNYRKNDNDLLVAKFQL